MNLPCVSVAPPERKVIFFPFLFLFYFDVTRPDGFKVTLREHIHPKGVLYNYYHFKTGHCDIWMVFQIITILFKMLKH